MSSDESGKSRQKGGRTRQTPIDLRKLDLKPSFADFSYNEVNIDKYREFLRKLSNVEKEFKYKCESTVAEMYSSFGKGAVAKNLDSIISRMFGSVSNSTRQLHLQNKHLAYFIDIILPAYFKTNKNKYDQESEPLRHLIRFISEDYEDSKIFERSLRQFFHLNDRSIIGEKTILHERYFGYRRSTTKGEIIRFSLEIRNMPDSFLLQYINYYFRNTTMWKINGFGLTVGNVRYLIGHAKPEGVNSKISLGMRSMALRKGDGKLANCLHGVVLSLDGDDKPIAANVVLVPQRLHSSKWKIQYGVVGGNLYSGDDLAVFDNTNSTELQDNVPEEKIDLKKAITKNDVLGELDYCLDYRNDPSEDTIKENGEIVLAHIWNQNFTTIKSESTAFLIENANLISNIMNKEVDLINKINSKEKLKPFFEAYLKFIEDYIRIC
jgi:hypothetical protein